ncbi:MAG: TolC family outer membrane protein [Burkholderiaceae bacterium]
MRAVALPAVTLALALAFAPAARAADLLDVWQAARQHDPAFAAARAAHQAGQARDEQAGALWRPTIALQGSVAKAASETSTTGARFSAPGLGQSDGVAFDTSVTNGTRTGYALGLRQPVYSRERSAQSQQLHVAAQVAEAQWQIAGQELVLRSAQAYFDAALAAEQLRLVTQQQAVVDKALEEAQDRFRIGDRPITDVHEATARAQALKAQRLAMQTELEIRTQALVDLTGLALDAKALALPGRTPPVDDLADLGTWIGRSTLHSPMLALAQARVDAAQAQAEADRAAFSPTVDLVAQVGRDHLDGRGDFGAAGNTASNRAIGIQVSVPLYTGGLRSARAAETQALADEARAGLEVAQQQAAQQTRAAWLDLAVGRSQTAALEAAHEASRARLDATRTGVQAGDRTTLDLLNAENDTAAAELGLQQARVRLLLDRLRLAASAGELDDFLLQRLNAQWLPHS